MMMMMRRVQAASRLWVLVVVVVVVVVVAGSTTTAAAATASGSTTPATASGSTTGATTMTHTTAQTTSVNIRRRSHRSLQSLTNETQDFISGPQVNQDRFVDFPYCYGALKRHDANGNGRMEQLEYLQFVQDLGSNTECLGALPQLPLEIMACWNQLSCECRARGGAVDCCEGDRAHIPISGVDVLSEDDATIESTFVVEEQQFLRQTCLRTDQCVIAFCGVPPPPVVPPPPMGVPVVVLPPPPPVGESQPLWWLFFLLALLLVPCCCRRRWCFFAGGKATDDESEASSESEVVDEEVPPAPPAGGARHLVTEEDGGDVDDVPPLAPLAAVPAAAADHDDPDANRVALRAQEVDEDGAGGGVAYSRSVQEPEWEEDPVPPGPKVIDHFDPPTPPQDRHELHHVEKEVPPPPPDDPYALEKYTPDGGIVQHERQGEWTYDADGGWTPEERPTRDPSEWNRHGYDREGHVEPEVVDNRRARHLEAMSGGAIFDHLDDDDTDHAAAPAAGGVGDMFSWVISSTLSTLDQKQDDLRSSGHGSHHGSDGQGGEMA